MESKFLELSNDLEAILNLYQKLIEISGQKQKELVNGNMEEIDRLNKEEEILVFQASRLETERFRRARELAAYYELPENAKLGELLEKAPPPEKEKLTVLLKKLLETIGEIDKINRENTALIQQSLKFINFTIDVLSQSDPSVTYSSGDNERKSENRSILLDKKV